MPRDNEFILTLSCRDTQGIVHAVSGLWCPAGCNIVASQQFGDVAGEDATGLFFMRVHFEAPPHLADGPMPSRLFGHVREQFGMDARLQAKSHTPRLDVEIPAIVSNHPDVAELAASYGVRIDALSAEDLTAVVFH